MKFQIRNAWNVAQHEVWTIVATKGFALMLLLPLVLLLIVSAIGPLAEKMIQKSKTNRTQSVRLGIIGAPPDLLQEWRERLQNRKLNNGLPLFEIIPQPILGVSDDILLQAAQKQVRDHKLDAIAFFQGDLTNNGKCEFYSMRGFNIELPNDLRESLYSVIRNQRLKNAGFDPQQISALTRGISWSEFEIKPEPAAGGEGGKTHASFDKLFAPALVSVMMMFFLVFTTSQRMLRGIVEEKTSRVVEILLSSLSPTELLAGKVFGFFLIGMIQFLVWVIVGSGVMTYQGIVISEYVQPIYLVQFMIFLATGYLFYAALFASIGAMVSDETESQGLQGFITIFIVMPMMFNFILITQPMWWPVRLLSYIPLLSPTIMAVRMVVTQVPWWEITTVALTSLACSVIATIFAARIFRVGILMTGKRPSPRELWRWCFYHDVSGVIES